MKSGRYRKHVSFKINFIRNEDYILLGGTRKSTVSFFVFFYLHFKNFNSIIKVCMGESEYVKLFIHQKSYGKCQSGGGSY